MNTHQYENMFEALLAAVYRLKKGLEREATCLNEQVYQIVVWYHSFNEIINDCTYSALHVMMSTTKCVTSRFFVCGFKVVDFQALYCSFLSIG